MSGELAFEFHHYQQPETRIDARAFAMNETARNPEVRAFIEEDQDIIQEDPMGTHLRILIGPSDAGKTTLAAHIARVNEKDTEFRQRLINETGDKLWQFMGIHLSLSQALDFVAEKHYIDKSQLNERHRAEASDVLKHAIDIAQHAFRHSQRTIGLYVDVVGNTESDLGRSMIEHYIGDRRTRVLIPYPNADVEGIGRDTRNYVANYLKLSKDEKSGYENIDKFLESRGIHPGTSLLGREEEFVHSAGTEEAWRRHWEDYYTQMKRHERVVGNVPPRFEQFISNDPEAKERRFRMYQRWIPERMKELGAVEDEKHRKVTYVDNTFVVKYDANNNPVSGIHSHFDRIYGKKRRGEILYRHFPLNLLLDNRPTSLYTANDVIEGMRRNKPVSRVIYEK